MIILATWASYVVEENIYANEVICEYECIRWEHFGVLCGNQDAYTHALRILGCPGRRATISTCSGPLNTPALAILPFPSPSNGVNEPSV